MQTRQLLQNVQQSNTDFQRQRDIECLYQQLAPSIQNVVPLKSIFFTNGKLYFRNRHWINFSNFTAEEFLQFITCFGSKSDFRYAHTNTITKAAMARFEGKSGMCILLECTAFVRARMYQRIQFNDWNVFVNDDGATVFDIASKRNLVHFLSTHLKHDSQYREPILHCCVQANLTMLAAIVKQIPADKMGQMVMRPYGKHANLLHFMLKCKSRSLLERLTLILSKTPSTFRAIALNTPDANGFTILSKYYAWKLKENMYHVFRYCTLLPHNANSTYVRYTRGMDTAKYLLTLECDVNTITRNGQHHILDFFVPLLQRPFEVPWDMFHILHHAKVQLKRDYLHFGNIKCSIEKVTNWKQILAGYTFKVAMLRHVSTATLTDVKFQ